MSVDKCGQVGFLDEEFLGDTLRRELLRADEPPHRKKITPLRFNPARRFSARSLLSMTISTPAAGLPSGARASGSPVRKRSQARIVLLVALRCWMLKGHAPCAFSPRSLRIETSARVSGGRAGGPAAPIRRISGIHLLRC